MIYFECLNQCCIFSEKKKSHRSRWLHQILIGEIVISYFYELFNRFGFSLLPPMQILRGDPFRLCRNMWSPLCALCVLCCLFLLGCYFGFHGFDQLYKLFLAFLSCLGVDILGYAFAVDSRCESSFIQVVVYHRHATRITLSYSDADIEVW